MCWLCRLPAGRRAEAQPARGSEMMPQNGVIALVATQQCLQTVSLVSSAPSLTFQQVVSVFVTRLSAPERAGRGRASKPLSITYNPS